MEKTLRDAFAKFDNGGGHQGDVEATIASIQKDITSKLEGIDTQIAATVKQEFINQLNEVLGDNDTSLNVEAEHDSHKILKKKKKLPSIKSLFDAIVRKAKGEELEEIEDDKGTEKEIALGDGYVLKVAKDVPKSIAQLYDRDEPTGVYVELISDKEMSEAEKVARYRMKLMLEPEEVDSETEIEEEGKMNRFKIAYEDKGTESLKDNYFVATDGDQVKRVKATYIIPLEAQKKIEAAFKENPDNMPEDVISPEEAIIGIMEECSGTMAGFRQWARKTKREAFGRSAAMKEIIRSVKPEDNPKGGKEPIKSVKEAEEKRDKSQVDVPPAGGASKRVKDYYAKLTPGVGDGEDIVRAIEVNSKLKTENETITAELKMRVILNPVSIDAFGCLDTKI